MTVTVYVSLTVVAYRMGLCFFKMKMETADEEQHVSASMYIVRMFVPCGFFLNVLKIN